jgi:twitching motility protein PilT
LRCRIIDSFPAEQQGQIASQLAATLVGIVSERLVPRIEGGRIPALEVMFVNSAVRNLIRENKIHQIYATMQMGQERFGMQTFNQSLANLYFKGLISLETAMEITSKPEELTDIIQRREGTRVTSVGFTPQLTRK